LVLLTASKSEIWPKKKIFETLKIKETIEMDVESNQTFEDFKNQVIAVPNYGFKVNGNHCFPEKRNQNLRPNFTQMLKLIPLACR
jgi:hypothetical protein